MYLSEAGIRKIVRKKIISEAGFDRTHRVSGDIKGGCDLSAIEPGRLAVWFARNFLYNAEGLTKKGLIDSLKNVLRFGRTEEEDAAFTKAVLADLNKNPERLGKYRKMIEGSISYFFGPVNSTIFCTFLNTLLGGGSLTSSQIGTLEKGAVVGSASTAVLESANKFKLEYPDFSRSSLTTIELFLFPKTSIALSENKDDKAVDEFNVEVGKMRDIVESPRSASQIETALQDYYAGIKNKRVFLKPIIEFLDASGSDTSKSNLLRQTLENEYNNHPFVKDVSLIKRLKT